jgi:hypothetical protein
MELLPSPVPSAYAYLQRTSASASAFCNPAAEPLSHDEITHHMTKVICTSAYFFFSNPQIASRCNESILQKKVLAISRIRIGANH